jgi:hypothetical protein
MSLSETHSWPRDLDALSQGRGFQTSTDINTSKPTIESSNDRTERKPSKEQNCLI